MWWPVALEMAGMEDVEEETEFTTRMVEIANNVMPNTMINTSGNTFNILRPIDFSGHPRYITKPSYRIPEQH